MINDIRRIAAEAGEAIMKTYDGPAEIETKEDDSPLTQADRAAHDCIVAALEQLTPDIPVLSEESEGIPTEERLGWKRFWLVDPLDGRRRGCRGLGGLVVPARGERRREGHGEDREEQGRDGRPTAAHPPPWHGWLPPGPPHARVVTSGQPERTTRLPRDGQFGQEPVTTGS